MGAIETATGETFYFCGPRCTLATVLASQRFLGIGPEAILQGFMVNDIRWTYYGAILAVVGVAEIVWSSMRGRA